MLLAGGVVCYVKGKNKKNTKNNVEIELHKCIAGYNDSVVAYLDAINNGNVSLDKINCVIRSIDTLRENKEITIDFAQEKSETLVNYVYDYTRKLAEANSFELIDLKKSNPCSVDNTLIDLRLFLETQKNIFEKAA